MTLINFENGNFTIVEKINLLERSILVNSLAYYAYDDNILSDFQYDANAKQLSVLIEENPEAFQKSRYRKIFEGYVSSTGYDLPGKLRKNKKLYDKISRDAYHALRLKKEKN